MFPHRGALLQMLQASVLQANVQYVQLGSNTRGQGGCEVNVVRALPGTLATGSTCWVWHDMAHHSDRVQL